MEKKIHLLPNSLTPKNLLAQLLEEAEDIQHIAIGVVWKSEESGLGVAWSSSENSCAWNALLADLIRHETIEFIKR